MFHNTIVFMFVK